LTFFTFSKYTMGDAMTEYIAILLSIGFALVLALAMLAMSIFFGPKRPSPVKLEPFECGMTQLTDPRGRFSVNFYLIAIIFVMFDVEIVYMYPWAITFKRLGLMGFVEMMIFIALLVIALVYAIKKGALEWD
jgi:NADH-quinone oxidoreductase subunit A